MKHIFVVAGELSGDRLGAWYIQRLKSNDELVSVGAVGGDCLQAIGADIYERVESLNIVGGVEILTHVWFIFSFMKKLIKHIVTNNFDEVVLIDFPGFNLRLLKKLKTLKPDLKITYLSPPQVWAWGEWRLKILKRYCDRIIVLYPFEVAWYAQRDLLVEWWGYPFYDNLKPYFFVEKKKKIALVPASRLIEVKKLLPLFISIIKKIKLVHPDVQIVLPLARSINENEVLRIIRKFGLQDWGKDIRIVYDDEKKWEELSSCCVALAKPGTNTLELAMLGVPSVVVYKTSWVTYFLARLLVKIKYMALPNLLLGREVFKEFIQNECDRDRIYKEFYKIFHEFMTNSSAYEKRIKDIIVIRELLK